MKDLIYEGPVRIFFRPTLFRGSKTALFSFLLVVGVAYVAVEFYYLKDFWSRSTQQFLVCWFTLPVIVTFLSLFSRFSWSVWIYDEKLVVKTYSFDSLLRIPLRQEIGFQDIDCIYYMEKEFHSLQGYRHKLREYKIRRGEKDYRKENLVQKYGVPTHTIEVFERSSQKGLNDYAATGILMSLDEILGRYKVPKIEKKQMLKELKNTVNFDFEHVSKLLSPYAINREDMNNLKDGFLDLDDNFLSPFLVTRLSVAGLESAEKGRGGAAVVSSMYNVLVLSNSDGTKKIYLKRFHSLSRADWQKLIQTINERKNGIKYLMPKLTYRNLCDPDFKPGTM